MRTGSWTGPLREKRAPRVEICSTVFGVRAIPGLHLGGVGLYKGKLIFLSQNLVSKITTQLGLASNVTAFV